MPIASTENKIPEEAMNAFLDGILSELRAPADPAVLTKVREVFRKRIPLHLRSYAAALLIMRAAGMTRSTPQRTLSPSPQPQAAGRTPAVGKPQGQPKAAEPRIPVKPEQKAAKVDQKPQTAEPAERRHNPPPKLAEQTVPLFVSMGKRQRLRPQELRDLITEKTGIPNEEMGRVHLFDNYSFIDIQISHAEKVVAACGGAELRGRPVEIQPAKKKGEQGSEKDQAE